MQGYPRGETWSEEHILSPFILDAPGPADPEGLEVSTDEGAADMGSGEAPEAAPDGEAGWPAAVATGDETAPQGLVGLPTRLSSIRFRLRILSTRIFNGRGVLCNAHHSPQALQLGNPLLSLRHKGVVVVPQLAQVCGFSSCSNLQP